MRGEEGERGERGGGVRRTKETNEFLSVDDYTKSLELGSSR